MRVWAIVYTDCLVLSIIINNSNTTRETFAMLLLHSWQTGYLNMLIVIWGFLWFRTSSLIDLFPGYVIMTS